MTRICKIENQVQRSVQSREDVLTPSKHDDESGSIKVRIPCWRKVDGVVEYLIMFTGKSGSVHTVWYRFRYLNKFAANLDAFVRNQVAPPHGLMRPFPSTCDLSSYLLTEEEFIESRRAAIEMYMIDRLEASAEGLSEETVNRILRRYAEFFRMSDSPFQVAHGMISVKTPSDPLDYF